MLKTRRSLLAAVILGCFISVAAAYGQALTLRGDRWLAVTEVTGQVELMTAQGERRQAVPGDRLVSVGDRLLTGANSSARLEIDQKAGYVSVAENSQLRVQTLSITTTGGRVTEIAVTLGQVRLRIRRLTNPDTRIEIHTPAGVSGVRGTDFGVAVQPNGQTGVATREGSVAARAQGQTVMVTAETQSIIYPGEPPTPPAPLTDDPTLLIETLAKIPGTRKARVVGYTDSVNLLEINQELQTLERDGKFDLEVSLTPNRRIEALVTTPLGTEQLYELVVP